MSAGKRGPVIWRRRYPVAGSCHSAASAVRCTPVASAGVSRAETGTWKAAASLPRMTAVGLLSARSIRLIIARDTPEASATCARPGTPARLSEPADAVRGIRTITHRP